MDTVSGDVSSPPYAAVWVEVSALVLQRHKQGKKITATAAKSVTMPPATIPAIAAAKSLLPLLT
jgi:hypothetical protein